MKKSKSLNIIQMIQNGLNKFAKILHIKPYLLNIILGLIAVILISLGLGARRDGFTSMNNAAKDTIKRVNDMNDTINSINWTRKSDKEAFIKNINTFYGLKMRFLSQGDTAINTFDKAGAPSFNFTVDPPISIPNPNPDGQVYKLDQEYNISGNVLPLYVDNDVDPGMKYTLESTINNPIKQTDLDALQKEIMDQIKLFPEREEKKLTDAFKALSKNADDIAEFMTGVAETIITEDDFKKYAKESLDLRNSIDADNILSSSDKAFSDEDSEDSDEEGSFKAVSDEEGSDKAGSDKAGSDKAGSDKSDYYKAYLASTASYKAVSDNAGSFKAGSDKAGSDKAGSDKAGSDKAGKTYGIKKSDIPAGSQDLYVLKSEYPPPSNPAGSTNKGFGSSPDLDAYNNVNPSPAQGGCKPAAVPPCPPCERCPESKFECKKVPRYNSAANNQYLPKPVLADFTQFGM